jgi:AbrB family looped-hinge helix DNA binding protein
MTRLQSVVTRKGQVTVPAQIRRQLGLERGDHVAFVLEDKSVRLARSGSVVEATRGVFKGRQPRATAEQMREAAERMMADEAGGSGTK